jgi:hypothetical protein
VDIQRLDTLDLVFQISFIASSALAAAWVRRKNLFGPMVQPPLIFVAVFVTSTMISAPKLSGGFGLKEFLFSVGLPLASEFPTMALGTAAALAIGTGRWFLERNPEPATRKISLPEDGPRRPPRGERSAQRTPRDRDEARGRGRRDAGERESRRSGREKPTPGARIGRSEGLSRSAERGTTAAGRAEPSKRRGVGGEGGRPGRESGRATPSRRPRRDEDYQR